MASGVEHFQCPGWSSGGIVSCQEESGSLKKRCVQTRTRDIWDELHPGPVCSSAETGGHPRKFQPTHKLVPREGADKSSHNSEKWLKQNKHKNTESLAFASLCCADYQPASHRPGVFLCGSILTNAWRRTEKMWLFANTSEWTNRDSIRPWLLTSQNETAGHFVPPLDKTTTHLL